MKSGRWWAAAVLAVLVLSGCGSPAPTDVTADGAGSTAASTMAPPDPGAATTGTPGSVTTSRETSVSGSSDAIDAGSSRPSSPSEGSTGGTGALTDAPVASGPGSFVSMPQPRVFDTRVGVGGPAEPLAAGENLDVAVSGRAGLPDDGVESVVLNLTITRATAAGQLFAYPAGTGRPDSAVQNFEPGTTVHALAVVQLGAGGEISFTNDATGTVDLIVNVSGYYLASATDAPGSFHSLPSPWLFDTATAINAPSGAVQGYGSIVVKVAGVAGVPAGNVNSVVLNLMVHEPSMPGTVAVYSTDATRPEASSIAFGGRQTAHNMVVVPLGADGSVTFGNSSAGTVQLAATVLGYFLGGSATAPGAFVAVDATRILDTGDGIGAPAGPVPARASLTFQVGGVGQVPAEGVSAVIVNVTAERGAALGNITLHATDTSRPGASDLFFQKGQTVSGLMIIAVGTDGRIDVANRSGGVTDVSADVVGYFMARD